MLKNVIVFLSTNHRHDSLFNMNFQYHLLKWHVIRKLRDFLRLGELFCRKVGDIYVLRLRKSSVVIQFRRKGGVTEICRRDLIHPRMSFSIFTFTREESSELLELPIY